MPFLGHLRCILKGLWRHPADFDGQTEGVLVSKLEGLLLQWLETKQGIVSSRRVAQGMERYSRDGIPARPATSQVLCPRILST